VRSVTADGATLYLDPRLPERFWTKVRRASTGCWEWTAGTTARGYGIFQADGRSQRAHRVAYEALVGPIADSLVIDHLCRTRHCVRPDHLEPVTLKENVLRGTGLTAQNRLKTHCPNGHPYDEANTRIRRGRRECRACRTRWS
jgi:hypothetical protein